MPSGTTTTFFPAGTMKLSGTVTAEVSLLVKDTVRSAGSVPEKVIVSSFPASPSRIGVTLNANSLTSSSRIVIVSDPPVHPAIEAAIVAGRLPLISPSFTSVTLNRAEVAPAGMTTVAGNWSDGLSLANATATSRPTGALAVTVPVDGELPSSTLSGKSTVKVAVSLSWMVTDAEPVEKESTEAVTCAICEPSSNASFTGVIVNSTAPAPAGITTPGGRVTSGLPVASVTGRSSVCSGTTESVAVSGPSPSVAVAAVVMKSAFSRASATRMSSKAKPSVAIG